jgi:hypothetical protein
LPQDFKSRISIRSDLGEYRGSADSIPEELHSRHWAVAGGNIGKVQAHPDVITQRWEAVD